MKKLLAIAFLAMGLAHCGPVATTASNAPDASLAATSDLPHATAGDPDAGAMPPAVPGVGLTEHVSERFTTTQFNWTSSTASGSYTGSWNPSPTGTGFYFTNGDLCAIVAMGGKSAENTNNSNMWLSTDANGQWVFGGETQYASGVDQDPRTMTIRCAPFSNWTFAGYTPPYTYTRLVLAADNAVGADYGTQIYGSLLSGSSPTMTNPTCCSGGCTCSATVGGFGVQQSIGAYTTEAGGGYSFCMVNSLGGTWPYQYEGVDTQWMYGGNRQLIVEGPAGTPNGVRVDSLCFTFEGSNDQANWHPFFPATRPTTSNGGYQSTHHDFYSAAGGGGVTVSSAVADFSNYAIGSSFCWPTAFTGTFASSNDGWAFVNDGWSGGDEMSLYGNTFQVTGQCLKFNLGQ